MSRKRGVPAPSTRNLSALPRPARLRELTQILALLDEIISEDWEGRYYSFDPAWGAGEAMASMRDGQGDHWFLWFGRPGLVLLGFAHEARPMTPYARADRSLWPGLLDGFPPELTPALTEPAFTTSDLTFCIWRREWDEDYHIGAVQFPLRDAIEPFRSDPDGSAELLAVLDDDPTTYWQWAEGYYERDLSLDSIRQIYARQPITPALVASLNDEADFETIAASARAMGFRVRGDK